MNYGPRCAADGMVRLASGRASQAGPNQIGQCLKPALPES